MMKQNINKRDQYRDDLKVLKDAKDRIEKHKE